MENQIKELKSIGFLEGDNLLYRTRKGAVREEINLATFTHSVSASKHNAGFIKRWNSVDDMLTYLTMSFSSKLWIPRPPPVEMQKIQFVD